MPFTASTLGWLGRIFYWPDIEEHFATTKFLSHGISVNFFIVRVPLKIINILLKEWIGGCHQCLNLQRTDGWAHERHCLHYPQFLQRWLSKERFHCFTKFIEIVRDIEAFTHFLFYLDDIPTLILMNVMVTVTVTLPCLAMGDLNAQKFDRHGKISSKKSFFSDFFVQDVVLWLKFHLI